MAKELSLTEKATRMAVIAHATQVRKDDDSPYIVHPFMVALMLSRHSFPEAVIAAGLVHDVLEDTDVTPERMRTELGTEVLEIVQTVSHDPIGDSWRERKQGYINKVRAGSESAKAVATADHVHNLQSLLAAYAEEGSTLWKKFSTGKEDKLWFEEEVLKAVREAWQHPLVEEYAALVEKMRSLV